MNKFLVVDAHPVLREGLAAVLRQSFAPAAVIGAADPNEAYRLILRHGDLTAVVLDLDLPGQVGVQFLRKLCRRRRSPPILALSMSEDRDEVRRVLMLGASGYLPKSMRASTVAAAVRLVVEGGIYVPPLVLAADTAIAPNVTIPATSRLTGRQSEILARLARGETNGAIAGALAVSEKTVKVHITAILRALGVSDRRQAARFARETGLV